MIKDFEYFAPKTVEEALTLLSQYKEESKVIAGGQSLLILMRQGLVAPNYLIDIKGISSLDYINFDQREGLKDRFSDHTSGYREITGDSRTVQRAC